MMYTTPSILILCADRAVGQFHCNTSIGVKIIFHMYCFYGYLSNIFGTYRIYTVNMHETHSVHFS